MEKFIAAVQVCGLTQMHQLPDWAQRSVTALGGPGFVVRGEQFHWYDYLVQVDFYGVKGMKRAEVEAIIHNAEILTSIERM